MTIHRHHTGRRRGVSRTQTRRVFPPETLRYTATRHGGSSRDLPPAPAHAYRSPVALWAQSRWQGNHPILLEPRPRGSPRLAPAADEGGWAQYVGGRGGKYLRATGQWRAGRAHRLAYRHGAERRAPRRSAGRP